MVMGENVVPVRGYGREPEQFASALLTRLHAYLGTVPPAVGGIVIQQSTEDADAEVWNLVYSDPAVEPLLATGRLGFELKVGQGAKPGLGGMAIVDAAEAERLRDRYSLSEVLGDPEACLRFSAPGTFTAEILRCQIHLMRNNYPRARVWVKLPPGRDIALACGIAWSAGADAVTVDGAEGGTGWAPLAFLADAGLPLAECLERIGTPAGCLLASGRMWEGSRAVKCFALGVRAVGFGRAALLAVDEDPEAGLLRLAEALALEIRMLVSALGKYSPTAVDTQDLRFPRGKDASWSTSAPPEGSASMDSAGTGLNASRHQPAAGEELLMDWNESPLGPPPSAVTRVLRTARHMHRYPRGLMEEVTALVAKHLTIGTEQVLLTAGVDEAIEIALTLAQRAWGTMPGFDAYADRAAASGRPFCPIVLGPDWQPVDRRLPVGKGDVVFLAQPANPTGNLFAPDWIRRVRDASEYVFIDETYCEFSSSASVLPDIGRDPGLLVYRSFSKAMGLAGIRVGCLVANAAVIDRLTPKRRFMPIDAISLNAAAGILAEPGFIDTLTRHVLAARPALARLLADSGLYAEVRETEANFVMARLRPDAAADVLASLDGARIRVKRCEALGLPGWLRISVGDWDDLHRLRTCLSDAATALGLPAGTRTVAAGPEHPMPTGENP
jgi:histidinol-phosphate/aromatic aminotransferase/cobyric acid decarboxylase-like protein